MALNAPIIQCVGEPVRRIILNVGTDYTFAAGQYLLVEIPQGPTIPLSIASAPAQCPELTLHFKPTPNSAESDAFLEQLTQGHLPLGNVAGDVICPPAEQSLLLIAGGTGSSQAFACAMERHLTPDTDTSTTLLWCADTEAEIFETDRLEQLAGLTLQVCVDATRDDSNKGMIWLREHMSATHYDRVIICGSPAYVYAVTDVLLACGVSEAVMEADAYSYAPRQT